MKRLAIASVVLAGLGAGLWWSNKQEAAKEGQADPNAPPKILEIKADDLQRIEIARQGQAPVVLTKENDLGDWTITAPPDLKDTLRADPGAAGTLTSAVASLASIRLLDSDVADLGPYGLEPPAIAVSFTLASGDTKVLRIGSDTADKSGVYASVDGEGRVYTMAAFNKITFDKGVADLRDRHLLTFDTGKLTSVTLNVAGQQPIEFNRTGELQWAIVKPRAMRADGFAVDELVRTVHDVQLDPAGDGAPFTSARPAATVRLNGEQGEKTLEIREIAGQYFARSSDVAGTYAISADAGMGVNKTLADFRNKKLFDFGFDDPTRIDINDGGNKRTVEKMGENWVSGGKTMDNIAVQNFIDKLRDFSASDFDNLTITQPEMLLTVVSKDGQRTETIELQQRGEVWAARRTDAPAVYQVDAYVVTGVREALNGVREPPEPDKNK